MFFRSFKIYIFTFFVFFTYNLYSKTYRVQKNDNLTRIARKFNVKISDLKRVNHLKSSTIFKNQVLKIPSKNKFYFYYPIKGKVNIKKKFSGNLKSPYYMIQLKLSKKQIVYTAAAGKVIDIGYLRGYGNYIIVDHENGWYSMYSNIQRRYIKTGQRVYTNQKLGYSHKTKLLFGVSFKGVPRNPGKLLKPYHKPLIKSS